MLLPPQENKNITLIGLGYDPFFEQERVKLGLDGFSVARVTAEHKGSYSVINEKGFFLAKITGRQMHKAQTREDYPAVGDWVAITELDLQKAVILRVLPRKTVIKRSFGDKNKSGNKTEVQVICANVDIAFVVESIDRDFSINRFERYSALLKNGGVGLVIVINKTDLISQQELHLKLAELKNRFSDTEIVTASAQENMGLDKIRSLLLPGRTYCFLGSSGVGKSSIINRLLGSDIIKTGSVSSYSGRGTHVTTNREMYFLENGGIVIDNPGIREVGMAEAGAGASGIFNEINTLAQNCKYSNCGHKSEPGCAVLAALKSGLLDQGKYTNYINLKKESEYAEMSLYEKRKKDKNFDRFIKKAKKGFKYYG